jgi:hypothetical protein
MSHPLTRAILVVGLAVIAGTPALAPAAEPDWKAVEADSTPGLSRAPREIEWLTGPNGQPGEHRVPVRQTRQLDRRAHRDLHPQTLGEGVGLGAQNLLHPDQIRVDLPEDIGDSLEIHSAIQAGTLVNVVARHGQGHAQNATGFAIACQPVGETPRS